MLDYNSLERLPTAEKLPSSDDTPVDNELQNLLPNLLLASLAIIWAERMDWYFGVDMGIYYIPNLRYQEPLIPDGFLSIGVSDVNDSEEDSAMYCGKKTMSDLFWH
ncbi:MAG: hypothetical protein PUP92_24170 [Rhizonema sp. PD38]|nr:hypothetical protein [Rhizonema sp. PD38]